MTSLVRSELPDEHIDGLRARVAEHERRLRECAGEITRVKAELTAFRLDYRQRVGRLHEELDDLERAIAEAELGERARHAAAAPDAARSNAEPALDQSEPLPKYTADAVRRLFRDVARTIHPDLAEDEAARDRRHTLMIEANRAYAVGDEERLRRILESWEKSPEAVQGSDSEATRLRLVRRLAQIDEQLAEFDDDLSALKESPMWRLKAMVDEAAGTGKDLVRDMVERLKLDIMVARNRLAAIQWTP